VGPADELSIHEATRVASLQQQQNWQFKGRISIRIEENGGTDGGSGNLSWVQTPLLTELDFHAALGRGAWHLRAGPEQAQVTLADGSEYRDADVQSLLHRQLGWDVPVDALSCWLRGLVVAPECRGNTAVVTVRDAVGRPQQIIQDEWQVMIHSWSQLEDISLPRKIEFSAPGRKFKLVIREWQLRAKKTD
jgi:outer membrane lipoprotein LolB